MHFRPIPVSASALACLLLWSVGAAAQISSGPPGPTPPYQRTVIVPAGGTATANGDALLSALANLSPPPDAQNRWLIKLEPGTYSVGKQPVQMREYVDIEGSGIVQTSIQGVVAPPPFGLLGGLVRGADNAEIRWLTVLCQSTFSDANCQGMSMHTASPRLTHMRIQVEGNGSGNHWGIRTFNSAPRLEDVEIIVTSAGGNDAYGLVYGGTSTADIRRSSITVTNGSNNNAAITMKENLQESTIEETSITARGGNAAYGIFYLSSFSTQTLHLEEVEIVAADASSTNVGIGENTGGSPTLRIRGGRIFSDDDGVNHLFADLNMVRGEVEAAQSLVIGNNVRIGLSHLVGRGVSGLSSVVCGGILRDDFGFASDSCP